MRFFSKLRRRSDQSDLVINVANKLCNIHSFQPFHLYSQKETFTNDFSQFGFSVEPGSYIKPLRFPQCRFNEAFTVGFLIKVVDGYYSPVRTLDRARVADVVVAAIIA